MVDLKPRLYGYERIDSSGESVLRRQVSQTAQRLLERDVDVRIPFARLINVPAATMAARRAIEQVLTLIQAMAWLRARQKHQGAGSEAQRRFLPDAEEYASVYPLLRWLLAWKFDPLGASARAFLGRTIAKTGTCPKYIVRDHAKQFTCSGFKMWCKRKNIRPRYGAVHQYGSNAVIERFIKSLKDEWLRRIVVPLRRGAMNGELSAYTAWFNEHRPHQAIRGYVPREVFKNPTLLEPSPCAGARQARSTTHNVVKHNAGLKLMVTCHEGRRHRPIIELKRAA